MVWTNMHKRLRALVGLSIATLAFGAGAADALPPPPNDAALRERQAQTFVDAMKPRRAGTPVIAIVASNEGTEITDLMLPHAVLRRSGVAQVQVVAPRRGAVTLTPALQIEAQQDFAGFDRAHPAGADYVIVPAMENDNDAAITAWLRQQADKGARVIGVCAGVRVVGRAGLLDGRRFTGHWYDRGTLLERHPGSSHVPHQRYLFDRGVATTTGITASVPTMLALVEAIGGRAKAETLAAELGVTSWTPVHDSTPFGLNASRRVNFLLNKAAFWRQQRWHVDVEPGMDDISLAFAADAWSRTDRVSVQAASPTGPVVLRSGLVLAAQPAPDGTPRLPLKRELKPVQQLDRTLCEIAERFGPERRDWVMLEMEYPGLVSDCPR